MAIEKQDHIFQLYAPENEPDKWVLQITCGTLDGPETIAFIGADAVRAVDLKLNKEGEVMFGDISKALICHYNELDEYAISLLKGAQAEAWFYSEPSKRTGTVSRRLLVRSCMQWSTDSSPGFPIGS